MKTPLSLGWVLSRCTWNQGKSSWQLSPRPCKAICLEHGGLLDHDKWIPQNSQSRGAAALQRGGLCWKRSAEQTGFLFACFAPRNLLARYLEQTLTQQMKKWWQHDSSWVIITERGVTPFFLQLPCLSSKPLFLKRSALLGAPVHKQSMFSLNCWLLMDALTASTYKTERKLKERSCWC